MALFGKKKNTEEEKVEKATESKTVKKTSTKKTSKKANKSSASSSASASKRDLTWVLKGPRITEKGAVVAERNNAYTFDIDVRANKTDVKQAIESIYKVVPKKVAIVKIPSKKVQVRGKRGKLGTKSGGKKAYVYLNKGDKIEFV